MRLTMSKDGIPRYTIRVEYRITKEDREFIAFALDSRGLFEGEDDPPKFRLATHKEIVEAIRSGFHHDMEWQDEAQDWYNNLKESKTR